MVADPTLRPVADQVAAALARLGVASERLLACPRATPQRVADFAALAEERGLRVLVAVGDAHLAAALAARTLLPVVAVGVDGPPPAGPAGAYPVAAAADGRAAAVLAAQILAGQHPAVRRRLARLRRRLASRLQAAHRRWVAGGRLAAGAGARGAVGRDGPVGARRAGRLLRRLPRGLRAGGSGDEGRAPR